MFVLPFKKNVSFYKGKTYVYVRPVHKNLIENYAKCKNFLGENINTNKCYKRSFAQISLLLLVLDMAFLYSKIQGE